MATFRRSVKFLKHILARYSSASNRELKQRRRRGQREQQKSNRFRSAKQQLCTCLTLFCIFLSRRCTTTTWKCLNWRFVDDGNTRQQLCYSFPELWNSPLEFNSNKICQHLTTTTTTTTNFIQNWKTTNYITFPPANSLWTNRGVGELKTYYKTRYIYI